MVCHFEWNGLALQADLTRPIDLSTVLVGNGGPNPSAWYVDSPRMTPVVGEGFVGAVDQGGAVNFRDVLFNPHGHGTHTECMGHITPVVHPVDPLFRNQTNHLPCLATTVTPKAMEEDLVVDADQLDALPNAPWPPALVVRTLPNGEDKKTRAWSNTNPPYFTVAFMTKLVEQGVKHLLVDLPSVDREVDGGRLEAHHTFWGCQTTQGAIAASRSSFTCPQVRQTACTCFTSALPPWTTMLPSAALCSIPWCDSCLQQEGDCEA